MKVDIYYVIGAILGVILAIILMIGPAIVLFIGATIKLVNKEIGRSIMTMGYEQLESAKESFEKMGV